MCHDVDSRPPDPPAGARHHASGERVLLDSSDGTQFDAYVARTDAADAPGILVLPDARGLHPFYEELCLRFAESGAHAVAMDYFAHTAGVGERDDDFDYMEHVRRITEEGVAADVAASVGVLRSERGGAVQTLFSVGFCLGGRISFNQAASDHGFAGVVGFYGGVMGRSADDPRAPIKLVDAYRSRLLGLFGGADAHITAEQVRAFDQALEQAGVDHEVVVYEGAPHSFFDRTCEQHRDACDDAWRRVLSFTGLAS